nr:membrane steroid-binding protein 1-like isoform X1 [Ipomoea trifida]
MALNLWTPLTEAIFHYTGLSPTAFFTIAALMVVTYKVVCGMFGADDDDMYVKKAKEAASRQPLDMGDMTEEELLAYNGSDPKKPLLMAIKRQIYDVSSSRMFYGPGGPYAMFTGKDASRALAQLSFDPREINGNLEGLSEDELEILLDWEYKFMEKYAKVGQLVPKKTAGELPEGKENGNKVVARSINDENHEHNKLQGSKNSNEDDEAQPETR